MWQHLQAWML
jgi:hypothetical protein